MDSQHRHELQQNDLRKLTDRSLPFFKKYGTPIVAAVGAVTLVLVGGALWYSSGELNSADGWTLLDGAVNKQTSSADDFVRVTEKHPGSSAAHWASLLEAEDYLKSGMNYLFTDREAALADLKKAQAAFERLTSGGSGTVSDIRERALFGLARCLESTADGKTETAAAVYRQLITEFQTSMFVNIANSRLAALEKPETKEFYAWFQQQNPKPQSPLDFPFRKPGDGAGQSEDASEADESDESMTKDGPASAEETDKAPATEGEPKTEPPANQPESTTPPETPGDATPK